MHACPCHDPWKCLYTAKSCKSKTQVPDAIIGTHQLREITLTENPRSSKAIGGSVVGQQPPLVKTDTLKNLNKGIKG